jgi:kynurenine formamidase
MRSDGSSAANDLVVMGTHVGTHIDALSHVSYQGQLHGDISAADAQLGGRFSAFGAETIEPMISRGLLLDIPATRGINNCEPAYEVTPTDLDKALALTGTDTRPGDVLIIRTGWGQFYDLREKYQGMEAGAPGPAEPAARWISSRQARAVGSDTIAFECIPPARGHAHLPVHRHLLVEAGIYIVEGLDLEELAQAKVYMFLFVLSSLKLVGATGSPVRPLAVPLDGAPA